MIASIKELDVTFSTGLGANLAQERERNLERSWRRKKALKKTPGPLLRMSFIWSEWVVDGNMDAKVLLNYPSQISCKTYIQVKSHKEVQSGRHKCQVTIQFVINNFVGYYSGENWVLMKAEQNGKGNESASSSGGLHLPAQLWQLAQHVQEQNPPIWGQRSGLSSSLYFTTFYAAQF